MKSMKNISEEAIALVLLSSIEKLLPLLSQCDGYSFALDTMTDCWNWYHNKTIKAVDLYYRLENFDEISISDYLEEEEDKTRECIWNAYVDALAYAIKIAYYFEGQRHLPQCIEIVNEETLEHFFKMVDNVLDDNGVFSKHCESFLSNYKSDSFCNIDEKTIQNFVKNNFPKII